MIIKAHVPKPTVNFRISLHTESTKTEGLIRSSVLQKNSFTRWEFPWCSKFIINGYSCVIIHWYKNLVLVRGVAREDWVIFPLICLDFEKKIRKFQFSKKSWLHHLLLLPSFTPTINLIFLKDKSTIIKKIFSYFELE